MEVCRDKDVGGVAVDVIVVGCGPSDRRRYIQDRLHNALLGVRNRRSAEGYVGCCPGCLCLFTAVAMPAHNHHVI